MDGGSNPITHWTINLFTTERRCTLAASTASSTASLPALVSTVASPVASVTSSSGTPSSTLLNPTLSHPTSKTAPSGPEMHNLLTHQKLIDLSCSDKPNFKTCRIDHFANDLSTILLKSIALIRDCTRFKFVKIWNAEIWIVFLNMGQTFCLFSFFSQFKLKYGTNLTLNE